MNDDALASALKEQTSVLRDIEKWVRFNASSQVKSILNSALDNDKKKLAYHLSDGKNTTRDISAATGLTFGKVSELWKEWLLLDLGETVSASGGTRFVKSFDLSLFGIQIPLITRSPPEAGTGIETTTPTLRGDTNEQ